MRSMAIALVGPRTVGVVEQPHRPLAADEVRLRTLFSGISTGTELTQFRGTNPYLHKHWDQHARLFLHDPEPSAQYPITSWGYLEVGEVIEVGSAVRKPSLGSIVYGTWGHRSEHMMRAVDAVERVLPPHVDPIKGVFAQVGAIALNGVLDSAMRLGETIAVFGLGVVGQIVGQLAMLAGTDVIGVDLLRLRLGVAEQVGMIVIDGSVGSAAETIKTRTHGRGADVCIEASGAVAALHEAIRACAYSSKVVTLGFYQGEAQGLALGEEFHHNRISIVCSQISGLAPELQHRWNRLRLVQTFMRLVANDKVRLDPLITHVVPASEAHDVFTLLDERPHEALLAVLDFRGVAL